jgi:hypothetical protein
MISQIWNLRRIPALGGTLVLAASPFFFSACSSTTAPLVTQWEGFLAPVLPHTVGGRGAAVTQFGGTQASIQIEEGEPETTYQWRVHEGTCQEPGLIQGGVASYPSLLTTPSGSSAASASLSEIFESGDQYAVQVFLSTEAGVEVVACGELEQVG